MVQTIVMLDLFIQGSLLVNDGLVFILKLKFIFTDHVLVILFDGLQFLLLGLLQILYLLLEFLLL